MARNLKGLLRRFAATEEELDAEALRAETEKLGCRAMDAVRRGELVSVTGRLRTVVYTPRTNLPTLEANDEAVLPGKLPGALPDVSFRLFQLRLHTPSVRRRRVPPR